MWGVSIFLFQTCASNDHFRAFECPKSNIVRPPKEQPHKDGCIQVAVSFNIDCDNTCTDKKDIALTTLPASVPRSEATATPAPSQSITTHMYIDIQLALYICFPYASNTFIYFFLNYTGKKGRNIMSTDKPQKQSKDVSTMCTANLLFLYIISMVIITA